MPSTRPSPRSTRWIGLLGVALAALAGPLQSAVLPIPAVASPAASAPAGGGSDRGTWQVAQRDVGVWRVTWRSPVLLPVTSDRPTIVAGGAEIGVPTVAADGRTVQVTVQSDTAPDPAMLDVLLSGDRLDVPGNDVSGGAAAPTRAPRRALVGADPATPGDVAVVSSDYQLAAVKLAGMPEPIEMVGHVVEPDPAAVTGPRPLVLFLHGRHDYCYDPRTGTAGFEWPCRRPTREIPSHLGYDYIQRLLASQGYATVSIRANGINAQDDALDDGGAAARAAIVRRHLDHWVSLAPAHQVDLSKVVLVGHSRGGEGVNRAALQIPLGAPYRIVGQVLIAPTDFGTQTAPYIPTATLLPYCDGDVIDLQGQRFTDTARDLTSDDTSLKSSVLVMGANHNFFNSEWTPGVAAAPAWDDWLGTDSAACGTATAARLTASEQRDVGKAWVAGAVRLFAEDAEQFLPLYDGSGATVASVGGADVRTHAIGGGRVLRKPGLGTGLSLPVGAQTQFCKGISDLEGGFDVCGRGISDSYATPHWPSSMERVPTRRFLEMSWTAAGQTGGMVFGNPLDLSGGRLELRTIVDPRLGGVRVRVRVTDSVGASATLLPQDGGALPALLRGPGLSRRWAQTLLVDTSAATGVDLAHVVRVDLVGDSPDGRIWVQDLAAAPTSLADVPDRRAPLLSLGTLRQREGAGPGTRTGRVPFRIVGEVTRPARFVAIVAGQERGDLHRFTVDVAPGQTAGSIPISYPADRRDDYPRSITLLAAWATRDLMTDDYTGRFAVLDDDPTPPITVTAVAGTVREGQSARWRVRLGAAVDYDLFVDARVVSSRRPVLTGGDIPDSWLRLHATGTADRKSLSALRAELFVALPRGKRAVVVAIPVRRDRAREPRESLSVRFTVAGKVFRSTIHVAASR